MSKQSRACSVISWLAVALLAACVPAAPLPSSPSSIAGSARVAPAAVARAASCPVAKQRELQERPQFIAPEERVPEFLLASQSCEIFDSQRLVGKQPFVVVFFASWCTVCEHKIPLVRQALSERADELTSLFVSLDDDDGWTGTEAFLHRHGMGAMSIVAGRDFLGFSFGYNPFRSVPVVVIVGRSGRVVDVQVGVRDGDGARLEQALDRAIDELPERALLTSYPPP